MHESCPSGHVIAASRSCILSRMDQVITIQRSSYFRGDAMFYKRIFVLSVVSIAGFGARHSLANALIVNSNYQVTVTNSVCGNTPKCIVTFPVVPAGKNLIVRRLSCLVGGSGVRVVVLETVAGSTDAQFVETFVNPAPSPVDSNIFYANAETTHLALSGQRVRVTGSGIGGPGSFSSMSCTIVGDLVPK